MAVFITDDCISCNACEVVCPNNAIYNAGEPWFLGSESHDPLNEEHTYVVPDKCTECVGFYDSPQCISVCPTDAIIMDINRQETKEQLMDKKEYLDNVGR